jgi:hypothetical protein
MAQKQVQAGNTGQQGQGTQPAGQAPKTKMDAVKRALAKLGRKAKPTQIRAWVKAQFGMDLSNDLISTYKGEILHKKGGKGKKKPAAKQEQEKTTSKPAPVAKEALRPAAGKATAAISLDDLRVVKGLLARVGADGLKGAIDLLSR